MTDTTMLIAAAQSEARKLRAVARAQTKVIEEEMARREAAEARCAELEDSRQRICHILRRADHAETFTADDLVTAWQDIRTELVSMGPPTGARMNPVRAALSDTAQPIDSETGGADE